MPTKFFLAFMCCLLPLTPTVVADSPPPATASDLQCHQSHQGVVCLGPDSTFAWLDEGIYECYNEDGSFQCTQWVFTNSAEAYDESRAVAGYWVCHAFGTTEHGYMPYEDNAFHLLECLTSTIQSPVPIPSHAFGCDKDSEAMNGNAEEMQEVWVRYILYGEDHHGEHQGTNGPIWNSEESIRHFILYGDNDNPNNSPGAIGDRASEIVQQSVAGRVALCWD